jgi:hypothetical protein
MDSVAGFCSVTVISNNNYSQATENSIKNPSYSSGTNLCVELAASIIRLLRKSKLLTYMYYIRLEQDM